MARLIRAIEMVAGTFLVLIALLTVTEAGLRYALGMRIPDAYVGATALQGIAIAWGIACTTWSRRHISVDAIYELLPRRAQRGIDVFASAVTFGAMLMLMIMLWRKTESSLASGELSNDLLLPLWPVVAATAAGIGAAALLGLARLGRDILDLRTR
ncbi:MAG: TRAP transporter small permease [Rhodobacteraceae bacterium]|nr:TRAP transporter small permease [Paracoccaceae bacterium]MBR9821961.1 TRAP transporter small permease [Paracoccaceae bacterium]